MLQPGCEASKTRRAVRRWFAWRLLGAAGVIAGWIGGSTARADTLTITVPSNQNVQLRLQGSANKDYVIQASDSLSTAVGTIVSDAQNRVQYIPPPGASAPGIGGNPAAFEYELERASNGVTSAPQAVAESLDPQWVYASFDDATQKLQLAFSLDGIFWCNTGDLYTAPAGNGVRDSSITCLHGVYYAAYTAGSFGKRRTCKSARART